jgi:hypothetical protein
VAFEFVYMTDYATATTKFAEVDDVVRDAGCMPLDPDGKASGR